MERVVKIVSQLSADGYFIASVKADECPRSPGSFLLPGGAIDQLPPVKVVPGMRYRPDGVGGWIEEAIPKVEAPVLALEELRAKRSTELPAWEEAERAAGIDHAGHRWLTTPAALQDIRDVLLAGVVPGGQWVTATRDVVPMDVAGLQELWAAIVTRGALIYRRRLELEALIPTLNREQLEAFAPGWPAENAG